MTAIGYIRVSTEEQAREGISLAAQEAKIVAYADYHGLDRPEIIVDTRSGKNLARDGIKKLLQACEAGSVGHVIVYRLDRLTRSVRDLLYLIEEVFAKHDVAFHSLTEQIDTQSAAGRFFLNIMGAMGQMERDLLSERVRDALLHKKEKGERLGQVRFGATDQEKKIVRAILAWRGRGFTLLEIAEKLKREGSLPRRGKAWSPALIRNVILRDGA